MKISSWIKYKIQCVFFCFGPQQKEKKIVDASIYFCFVYLMKNNNNFPFFRHCVPLSSISITITNENKTNYSLLFISFVVFVLQTHLHFVDAQDVSQIIQRNNNNLGQRTYVSTARCCVKSAHALHQQFTICIFLRAKSYFALFGIPIVSDAIHHLWNMNHGCCTPTRWHLSLLLTYVNTIRFTFFHTDEGGQHRMFRLYRPHIHNAADFATIFTWTMNALNLKINERRIY